MNERIKQLAEQHGFIHEHMSPSEQQDALRKYEKFANFVICECARVANTSEADMAWDYTAGRKWASIDILNHFGV